MIMAIISICAKIIIGLLALVGAYTLTIWALTYLGMMSYDISYGECKKPFDYLKGETVHF